MNRKAPVFTMQWFYAGGQKGVPIDVGWQEAAGYMQQLSKENEHLTTQNRVIRIEFAPIARK